jgi:type III restriction enzyme
MATGTGKTTVMGMLAAWTILNKVNYPQDKRFSDTVLIICPNVTIRERLAELNPDLSEISLYRTRELVPYHRMEELRKGQVIILNWHKLERQQMNTVNGKTARVVKRGVPVTTVKQKTADGERVQITETLYYESDAAFVKRVLGAGRGRSQSIFVFNDKAHHAYRRGDTEDEQEVVLDATLAKLNDREATVWIEGLDRINKLRGGNSNGIRLCLDLSATPFYIQGSGNEVGKPFSWIVSDFSLLEAIESGLVKVPQLPTQDLTGQETPSYFNIWRWVQEQLEKDGVTSKLTPELVLKYAATPIRLLATDWEKTFTAWEAHFKAGKRRSPVPPVFIIVCRDTALAKEVHA